MAFKFTDKSIAAISPPESGRKIKTEGNGLYILISPKGMRKWLFTYRWEGKPKWIDLGKYPAVSIIDARKLAHQYQDIVDRGADPLAKVEPATPYFTVSMLGEEYMTKWAKPRKKSAREDERILRVDVMPHWGERAAVDIKKRDVILLLEGILNRGAPIASNMTLAVIRRMFNFGVERDLIPYSPVGGLMPLAKSVSRDRVLTFDEIRQFWSGLDGCSEISPDIKRVLKLTLLTAQRPGEVVGMQRSEIAGHWWVLPGTKVKNGMTHRVYLSELALQLIGEGVSDFVFRSPLRKKEQPIGYMALSHCTKKLIKVTGIAHFTPHDLRRTAATGIATLGFSNEVIDKVLGHKAIGVVAVYNRHAYDSEKQAALEAWSRKLGEIVWR